MGVIVVEVCEANAITTLDIEGIIESEFSEVAVVTNECLVMCGLCRASPFALVNNKRVYAKTPEECLEKIRETIKKELAVFQ